MSLHVISFENLDTGAVADAETTLALIRCANTTGHRCRIREICVGPSIDAPADLNVGVSLQRDNAGGASAGTGTAATPEPHDTEAIACVQTGLTDCTAEPTYDDVLFRIELNGRSSLDHQWTPEDAPVCNQDQAVGLVFTPRTAAAHVLSGHITFETF